GYETLAAINPRLIYCSVSAFGRTGPRKDSPGYEALMQAFSGIMSITGEPGGQPVRAGVSFLDLSTGMLCALGVCAAVIQREKTGLGQRVDGSLLETAVSLLAFHAEGYLLTGAIPKALGSGHPSLSPYRNFKCKDGQWIFIAAANDRFWQKLAGALELGDLATDPRFAVNQERVKNRGELEALLERVIGEREREPLLKLLGEADGPAPKTRARGAPPRGGGGGEGGGGAPPQASRRGGRARHPRAHGGSGDERPADDRARHRAEGDPSQARRDSRGGYPAPLLADEPEGPSRRAP